MNIPFFSAKKLASLLRRRKMRSVDLLDLYLDRVARLNPKVNAIVVLDEKHAREQARKADRAAAKGNWLGPLHGVPMTVKESFDVAGLPTTWGRADMKSNIAARNALAVQRLRDADYPRNWGPVEAGAVDGFLVDFWQCVQVCASTQFTTLCSIASASKSLRRSGFS